MRTEGDLSILQKYWPSPKGIGGAERATERFSSAIAKENEIRVCVYTCGDYARGAVHREGTSFPQVETHPNGLKLLIYPSMSAIAEAVTRNKDQVAVLQVGWGFEHYPKSLERLLNLGLPTILRTCETGHFDQLFQEIPQDERLRYRQVLLSGIDKVVAISQPLAQEAISFGFPPDKVTVIYSSVPTDVFKPLQTEKHLLRRSLGLSEDAFIFLFAGRLVEEKGVDLLLNAWEELAEEFKDLAETPKLVLIGNISNEGNTAEILKRAVEQYPSVIYRGVISEQSEVARYYQAADLLVYPSFHREGLALSVVEAMSTGLPVLTTNWAATETGMKDLVIPGKTGFVFAGNSPSSLAKQLSFICREEASIHAFGENARAHVLSLGVDDRIAARKYLDVYKELLGDKSI